MIGNGIRWQNGLAMYAHMHVLQNLHCSVLNEFQIYTFRRHIIVCCLLILYALEIHKLCWEFLILFQSPCCYIFIRYFLMKSLFCLFIWNRYRPLLPVIMFISSIGMLSILYLFLSNAYISYLQQIEFHLFYEKCCIIG